MHINPHYHAPFDLERERVYLHWASEAYKRLTCEKLYTTSSGLDVYTQRWPHSVVVRRLYFEGRIRQILRLEFAEFERLLRPAKPTFRNRFQLYKRSDDPAFYYPIRGAYYREKVPTGYGEKKVVSEREQSRRDWRKKKRFRDAGAKKRGHYWGDRSRVWARQTSNRWSRRKDKEFCRRARLDHEIEAERIIPHMKGVHDSWMWD